MDYGINGSEVEWSLVFPFAISDEYASTILSRLSNGTNSSSKVSLVIKKPFFSSLYDFYINLVIFDIGTDNPSSTRDEQNTKCLENRNNVPGILVYPAKVQPTLKTRGSSSSKL
jgi:hypothetical protein